jgi:hypothetical protein
MNTTILSKIGSMVLQNELLALTLLGLLVASGIWLALSVARGGAARKKQPKPTNGLGGDWTGPKPKLRNRLSGATLDVEISKNSGLFIWESIAVDVVISRERGAGIWKLGTICHNARDWTCSIDFATDLEAWDYFLGRV